MKIRKMKNIITAFLALLLLVTLPVSAFAVNVNGGNRTVRAGFFAYPGYHELEGETRSGYGYDFLRLLQRYTDLNYEFVGYENSWEDMQRMLLSGEIDLVTSARKTAEREKLFDFSEPIGTNSARINVRADDERFIPGDFAALNGVTIGEISGNSRNDDVRSFARKKGFTYRVKEYRTADELDRALQAGEVDAAATSSLRKSYGEKTLAEFAPQEVRKPICVALYAGNAYLMAKKKYVPMAVLAASHTFEYFYKAKKIAADKGIGQAEAFANCLAFGFTWWLPLSK